ncbi:MAG: amidase, partial [Acidobacteria bacterium]|nr:amidase [Acidobacteriota bacterium]
MTFEEFDHYDAVGLAALIRQGEVSEAEVLDTALRRIDACNPSINAVVLRMDEAAWTTVANGVPQGPLAGVPTLLKDLGVHCAGTPTSDGSLLATNKLADHDSAVTVGL